MNLTRREFLRWSALGMATMVCGSGCGIGEKREKPNILFIAIDDLNDWTGCLGGHPDIKTPHLDALAKRGVLFTNAYCAAPACNPSRAALMTGIRPSSSGIYHNRQPWRKSPVLQDAITIPQHFMAHGYKALGSGKIYHSRFPDPQSWQEYWPSQTQNKPDDPKRGSIAPGGKDHFDWGPLDVSNEEMGDWQVADWIIGQLEKKHEKPFFLACGFFRPHLPWYVPQKYFDMYPSDKISLPNVKNDDLEDIPEAGWKMAKPEGDHARILKHNAWRKAVQGYLASISFVDDCLGRVIDALDKSPNSDNTFIVLWSDHGWHLGEKLHWRKFALWEEATHNVLIFVAPGVTSPGARCEAPVNLLDIYPTLIELCQLTPKRELEGVSLIPLLKDPEAKWDRPALTTHGRNNHSLRSKRWRYIRYADGTEELYDHLNDELEWDNLAGDHEYTSIKQQLSEWLPKKNVEDIPEEKKAEGISMKRDHIILAKLDQAEQYFHLHPSFEKVFTFLRDKNLTKLSLGRHEIEGDRLFCIIQKEKGRTKKDAKLEAHRKYIDIQYVISGIDEMGWKPTSECSLVDVPYDEKNDIGFFNDPPESWNKVPAGSFTIFFPEDAHAPMVSEGDIHKIVFKVAIK